MQIDIREPTMADPFIVDDELDVVVDLVPFWARGGQLGAVQVSGRLGSNTSGELDGAGDAQIGFSELTIRWPKGEAADPATVRSLPWKDLLAKVTVACSTPIDGEAFRTSRTVVRLTDRGDDERGQDSDPGPGRRTGRPPLPDATLTQVAMLYREAEENEVATGPYIADRLGVTSSTARNYILRARQRGLLDQSARGRRRA